MQNVDRVCLATVALILFLFIPSITNAQAVIGAKIGIDVSSLPNAGEVIDQVVKQGSVETSSKVGVTFGGFVSVPITSRLSFQPELMFVAKGVKLTEAGSNGTVTASMRYLEFPMLIRYGALVGENAAFLLVGPTFGVKASTSAHLEGSSQSTDLNIDSAIRSFDAGLAFAGGIDYGRYLFEVRYTQGLSDIGVEAFPHADRLKNRVFAVLAGVRFK